MRMMGESPRKAVTSSQLHLAAAVAAEREAIRHLHHQEVEAVRTTTTMENLAKKYLSGDEVVEVKLANNYWCYFSATLTILWSDLHVHVCMHLQCMTV